MASASARRVECSCSRSRRRLASSSSSPTTSFSRSSAALSIYSKHASVSVRTRPYCMGLAPLSMIHETCYFQQLHIHMQFNYMFTRVRVVRGYS